MLNAALAAIRFWGSQKELIADTNTAHLQKKVGKIQESCRKKLEEVYQGYTNVSAGRDQQCWCCAAAQAVRR